MVCFLLNRMHFAVGFCTMENIIYKLHENWTFDGSNDQKKKKMHWLLLEII